MSNNKNISPPERGQSVSVESNLASSSDVSSIAGSVKIYKTSQQKSSSSERQIKFERAQKCLENAALVSKRIKEHRKATAELLGRPFEEDDGGDTALELASTMSEKTGYSAATDTSTTLSVQDALNIPGISESLANTLKQKELLMERIKQYKEISKRPMTKASISKVKRDSIVDIKIESKQTTDAVDVNQLLHTLKEKENSLSVIQVKMKAMETTILDLQDKINEKDQIIEAKNKATSLMSDSLSKKEKDSLDLLEDTRQQMTKMQENFIAMETEWKGEKQKLLQDIEMKEEKIKSLEEANSILETSRFEISVAHSKLIEEIDAKNEEIKSLQEKVNNLAHPPIEEPSLKEKDEFEEEKGSLEIAGMVELTKKIELLEQINCQIRQTNKELENKLAVVNIERKSPSASIAGKRGSPLPTRKGGRNTASKSKSPWSQLSSESLPQETDKKAAKAEITRLEMLVQSLNKDILEKEYEISQKEATITELQSASAIPEVKDAPDMVEIGTCTDLLGDIKDVKHIVETTSEQEQENNFPESVTSHNVNELEEKLLDAERQIESLQKDMEVANLNMIKVKSAHKLKVKQLQKTIDSFSKVSDAHTEVVRLQQELQDLTRKVAILEEEKGNLQLHLVDYDSGRLTESDMYKKMRETENLSETRLKAISVLEAQKFDLVQELHMLQQKNAEMEDKLADISQLQSEHVCSEMKSVEMEEQIDELTAAKKELELVIENLKLDKEHLNEAIKGLQDEKIELTNKLENYIQENMELTDKLEKLTAEKVSSAESIEIVESLTTQEKLELEEYNKGIFESKSDDHSEGQNDRSATLQNDKNIDSLIEQREELNKKIEILMQEKEEVMETIAKITNENQALLINITELKDHNSVLINSIESFDSEKKELLKLNQELIRQVDDLKNERIEIMKESVEIAKPIAEDATDGVPVEVQHDEKATSDKGAKGAKTVKQLTKEILKLKNIIKEREDEIADCQMKILSLEEQQQKQNELLQTNVVNENKIKLLTEEIRQMKQDFEKTKKDKESEQHLLQLKQSHELLQQELHKVHQEYSISVSSRDARITELENVLLEYEKQMYNYSNSLQQKDKELAEYINQITKLNDVSQKLRSTIELLEEEKAKDQNVELVKNLNKQMAVYQKKLLDNEEKIKILEDEKMKLHCLKGELMSKNINIETELKKMKEIFNEKQIFIKELQAQQQKHVEEMTAKQIETTERDEEIHEIKLQLRKESIENEKLRNNIFEKETIVENLTRQLEEIKEKFNQHSLQTSCSSEQYSALETKNRELMEKLKKLAIGIKKKAAMNSELEANHEQLKKQLAAKSEQVEQLLIQVETLPALQEKCKHADHEVKLLQSHKAAIEQQRIQDLNKFQVEMKELQDRFLLSSKEVSQFNESLTILHKDLNFAREENLQLKAHVDVLNKKNVELEIEQRNNINLSTKISSLEADINHKQIQISELLGRVEYQEQQHTQVQYGYDAKMQERDLNIENLETEIDKYKSRICRLEESISIMEDRRHSLERKADQLGSDLEEKQKAYTEYASQEDELVTRLAALMDHDRVLEKQLHEIDNENKELQFKVQHLSDDNQRLRKAYSDIQENYTIALEKANKFESKESEITKYQGQLRDLETNLKKVTHDYQSLITVKKQEIEELEFEFNTQIENAIKEKKTINEKYEKLNEYVSQLENKLHEYKSSIENLNANIAELNRLNQELSQKASNTEQVATLDYTEQYISEINRLNSVISSKSNEIYELHNKIQSLQTNNVTTASNFDSKISELTFKLNQTYTEMQSLTKENNSLRLVNEQLQNELSKKDTQIRELMDSNKLQFEMNIPKTEGMVITSTIEPLSGGGGLVDVLSLETQIVSNVEEPLVEKHHDIKKVSESLLKQTEGKTGVEEPLINAKKAYVCYTKEDEHNTSTETDPFNSDEGWGLGESEEVGDVTPGLSHLNSQIEELKKDNAALKADIQTNNVKLLKAVKKLKELKACNEVLTNELKTARQTSQTSFFDNAIDDELRENIKLLEKKIEELNEEILKEKRDKESLRKQNEVFHNANDRLTEMKEKLDNEIQLWKYKFKEANDKASTLQWGSDNKDATDLQTPRIGNMDESKFKEEIDKIEKENEELHSMVDQVNALNQEFLSKQTILESEIANLNKQLQQVNATCVNCEHLKFQIDELKNNDVQLKNKNILLSEKLQNLESQFTELSRNYEILKGEHEEINLVLQNEKAELFHKNNKLNEINVQLNKMQNDQLQILNKNRMLEEELIKFKESESDKLEILKKKTELEDVLLKFDSDKTALLERNNQLAEELLKLNQCESEKTELLNVKSNLEEQLMELKQLYSAANEQISCLAADLETAEAKLLSYNETPSNNIEISDGLVLSEKCKALEEHIVNLKLSLDEANAKVSLLESENQTLVLTSNDYQDEINQLNIKIQQLNGENDNLLSTVAELRSSVSSAVDQRGFEIAELWKQHLGQREADFQKIETDLRTQLNAAEIKYEQLLENVQSSNQEETNKLVIMEQVNSLQNKLEDKEEHLRNLQIKYAETMNELDMLRSEMEDEKVRHENKLLEQQEEYERMIQEAAVENQKQSKAYEERFKNIQNELLLYKSKNEDLNQIVEDLQAELNEAKARVTEVTNQLRLKDSEIYQKTHDYTITLAQRNEEFENVRQQLIEYEKKIEELSYEKEAELAVMRLKIHEKEKFYDATKNEASAEKAKLMEALNSKIVECTNLNKQIIDLNQQLQDHSMKAAEMESALENQEIEIVTLKDEIVALQNSMRTASGKIHKHVSFSSDTKLGSEIERTEPSMNKDLLDAVPRAELDLALYMLHQRDVRCEELTMELTQLLEERDTLQLRLSDSLRLNEDLKKQCKTNLEESIDSQETIAVLPSFSVEKEFIDVHRRQSSRSSSMSDIDGEKPKLQAKLSELRTVKHSRDVRLRNESEQRQLDLRLLQQDVANLPPEAVDQLAQAHHTLSRDSQSTSTVLLNWLRGKSTPKVVHM